MKKLICLLLCAAPCAVFAGQWASVKYVHDALKSFAGITYASNPSINPSYGANMEYLLKVVDQVNAKFFGGATSYGTSQFATKQAVDTVAVKNAINTLIFDECQTPDLNVEWVKANIGLSNNVQTQVVNNVFFIMTDGQGGSNFDGNSRDSLCYNTSLIPTVDGFFCVDLGVGTSGTATIAAIAYGDGIYIGVGAYGNIFRSSDLANWTNDTSNYAYSRNSIAFGNSVFVTPYGGSSDKIMKTTNNGTSWALANMPATSTWVSVAFNGGRFIAVSEEGLTAYSDNGGNIWKSGGSLDSSLSKWRNVIHGAGKWWALSEKGYLVNSADGITWNMPVQIVTNNNLPLFNNNYVPQVTDISLIKLSITDDGNTMMVFYTGSGDSSSDTYARDINGVYFSHNGRNWIAKASNNTWFRGASLGNGYFIAGGSGHYYYYAPIPEWDCGNGN